jgi:hypothetical protein
MYAKSLPFAIAAALLIIQASLVSPLQAAQVQLSWNAPTTNADGTPLTDLAGYKVYYGQASKNYTFVVNVGNQSTYTVTGLQDGQTYYFAVRAYDTSGNESTFSNEVNLTPPPPSGGIRISLSPKADTFINIDSTNYSTQSTLNTYTWPDKKVANAILMRFDLSSIPSGSTIYEAKLNLALIESDSTIDSTYTITVHKLKKNPTISRATGYTYNGTNSWTANTYCYQSIPLAQADISPSYDTKAIDKTSGYKTWTITSMVQEWIAKPTTNFGLLLNSDPSKLSDRYRTFASKEHSNTNIRPYLSISYGASSNVASIAVDGISKGSEKIFSGTAWHDDSDGKDTINLLDADSDNDNYSDALEMQYGSDPAYSVSRPLLIEVGEVVVDHTWNRVALHQAFLDPVVVAKPPSDNDAAPAVVRIRNVNRTGFDIRVQDWDYLDGTHALETVGYIVMERGHYTLDDGTIVEAGRFNTNKTSSFGSFMFSQPFNVAPVLITAVSSFNKAQAVTGRLKSISTTGFKFRLQQQELNQQTHATETIAYIAWEPSSGKTNGLTFEVGKTQKIMQEQFQTIQFTEPFVDIPVFIADMQTANDGEPASLRWDSKDLFGVDVIVEEEQSSDNETDYNSEVVGYLVIK